MNSIGATRNLLFSFNKEGAFAIHRFANGSGAGVPSIRK